NTIAIEAHSSVNRQLGVCDPLVLDEGCRFHKTPRDHSHSREVDALGERAISPPDRNRVIAESTRDVRMIDLGADLEPMLTAKRKRPSVVGLLPLETRHAAASVREVVALVAVWQ